MPLRRATRMTRLFVEHFQFDPRRLSAAGYGEYHPVTSNDTAEGRGQNRRVDIIVLPSVNGIPQTASLEATSQLTSGDKSDAPTEPPAKAASRSVEKATSTNR